MHRVCSSGVTGRKACRLQRTKVFGHASSKWRFAPAVHCVLVSMLLVVVLFCLRVCGRLFTYVAVQVAIVTKHSTIISAEAVSAHLNVEDSTEKETIQ